VVWSVVVLASCICLTAWAQVPSGVLLSWSAPEECPSEGRFVAEVERFLGQAVGAKRDQKLTINGFVDKEPAGGFSAKLRVLSQHGTQERRLTHENCTDLTEAAALVAALAIDPTLTLESTPQKAEPPLPAPEPDEPPASSDPSAAEPKLVPPPTEPAPAKLPLNTPRVPASKPWSLSAAALAMASTGALPGAGVGLGGRLTIGRSLFQIAARGGYFLPRFVGVAGAANSGVELDLWSISVQACLVPVRGEWLASLCVGPDIGDLRGRGVDLEKRTTEHGRWSALGLDATLSHVNPWGLDTLFGVGFGPALETPRFGIKRDGRSLELFRSDGWSALAFVGIGIRR
jgi:hypothetical protein